MVRWKKSKRSDDMVDRRGSPGTAGVGGIPIPLGSLLKLGTPGVIILIAVVLFFTFCGDTGVDPGVGPLGPSQGAQGEDPIPRSEDPEAELVDFLSFVLDDVQDEWDDLFRLSGLEYERAELVLFDQATQSGCGGASTAVGPHYCPLDQRVYIDLEFFRQLSTQYGAKGDFAQAYVLAHEIGHHVQNLLGTLEEVQSAQQANADEANELSIRLELQADCFAGVWGFSTFQRDLLDSGDLDEALDAAAAVGDDRIQEASTGYVNPENWTHGSAEQRKSWYRKGFDEGDPTACDTFSGDV